MLSFQFHANFPGYLPDNDPITGSWDAAVEDARLWLESEVDSLGSIEHTDSDDRARRAEAQEALDDLASLAEDEEWCACVGMTNLSIVEVDPEPEPEDYVIASCGPLGSRYTVGIVDGAHIGEYDTMEEAEDAIREDAGDAFRPAVWWEDDHGGNTLLAFNWEVSTDAQ